MKYINFLQLNPNITCNSPMPMGCIYEELISSNSMSIRLDPIHDPTPSKCHSVCSAGDAKATHVAIRWDLETESLICMCLQPSQWNSSLVGPDLACNIPCEPSGN